MDFFNYRLTKSLDDIEWRQPDCCAIVVDCLNPHSFVTALDDEEFRQALEGCDYLLPDGEGICMAMRWIGKKELRKIAGDDLHTHLLKQLDAMHGKAFYMGSAESTLESIRKRLSVEYPNITVEVHAPSFSKELPEGESLQIVEKINSFAPDVLFVSMSAPKQEKWVEHYRKLLGTTKLIAPIGGVFDFYSGRRKRAGKLMLRLKLEWLVRLVKEPRRMWRRNLVSAPRYVRYVLRHRKEMCD